MYEAKLFFGPRKSAFNPHLPPELEEVDEPGNPEHSRRWKAMSDEEKVEAQQNYQVALQRRKEYEQAVETRLQSPEYLAAPQELAKTVRDLERRGLLQYDGRVKRYDLHPVVRGVASGGLRAEERDRYGQVVVDHFSKQGHNPYEEAETLEDLRDGLHVVRTLLKMGRFQQAVDAYRGGLARALYSNLEAYAEILSLLRPFFPQGWDRLPGAVDKRSGAYLANVAAMALDFTDELKEGLAAYGAAVLAFLEMATWRELATQLRNISWNLSDQNFLSKAEHVLLPTLDLATLTDDDEMLFMYRLRRFDMYSRIGQWSDAEAIWRLLDPMGRDWARAIYRPGDAESHYAWFQFRKRDLREEHLAAAERLATEGKNRLIVRDLHGLRGAWQMEQGQWALAAESLHEAVRMARGVNTIDARAETQLALASFHLGQLTDPRREAEQLAQASYVDNLSLAELWLAIGDREQAKKHALAAYQWAWADGEPYVRRYELNKATALLKQLNTEIPNLPPYDPAKDEKFPWEDKLAAAIEKLRAEKEAEKNSNAPRESEDSGDSS
jgi:hypothetical protein